MDLSSLISVYPDFLSLLEERGYKQSTIEKYNWVFNRMMRDAGIPGINSFEDYFLYLKERFSATSLPEIKGYLGTLKHYVQTGEFVHDTSFRCRFMEDSSYHRLNGWYKSLVDFCLPVLGEGYAKSTLKSVRSAASVFCLHFQQLGHASFATVDKQDDVLAYFHDGTSPVRSSGHKFNVDLFLTACSDMEPSCARMLSFLPGVPDRMKNYDYLKPEECRRIEEALSGNRLSLRDKAIGVIAYYTGLRSSDIAGLMLDDFDLERGVIMIEKQVKTGVPLTLPLRPIVRDAVCEYVEKERPLADDDHVFLTERVPYRKLNPGSLNNASQKIFDAADVRVGSGRRGLHLFRHAFVSDLISKDVPRHHVSAMVGHTSLHSLDAYIDADIEHLQSCSLSIEAYSGNGVSDAVPYQYRSGAAGQIGQAERSLASRGLLDPYTRQTLCLLDEYCMENHPGVAMTQHIIDLWSAPGESETAKRYTRRMACAEKINTALIPYGLKIKAGKMPQTKKRMPHCDSFASSCKEVFENYVAFRKASSKWCYVYDHELMSFDRYCFEHIPNSKLPDQDTIDGWSLPYKTERLTSCGKRVAFLSGLCKFIGMRYGVWLSAPEVPTNDGHRPVPHSFTEQELKNLFIACDNIPRFHLSKESLLRTLTVPAFFRLMYSSGLRTKEARMLDCSDVDLKHGVINISRSKGLHEHRVALHPSMLSYLEEYDERMQSLVPGRRCFFANVSDRYYSSSWVEYNFELAWYRFNGGHAIPYALRHHYASANINSWPAESDIFDKNLVYLSRSMGHASVENTMYYYCQSPRMAQALVRKKSATFSDVISGVKSPKLQMP